MYVCMYVCSMYVCMHVCMYVCMHVNSTCCSYWAADAESFLSLCACNAPARRYMRVIMYGDVINSIIIIY